MPPTLRIHGRLVLLDEAPDLSRDEMHRLLYDLLTDEQKARFEATHDPDFSLELAGVGRFRVNAFMQRLGEGMVLRLIPSKIRTLDDLGMPEVLKDLATKERGLILVTGPTGSGKSTTLAAMVDHMNQNRDHHIIPIEDPIEFVHPDARSIVSQREVGTDCESYSLGLRDALRQAPDVILIGEIRDEESATAAAHFAETGHLVLSTLHATNAGQTLERLMQFFPASAHAGVALQISLNLNATIAQRLLPLRDGSGRVVAVEVMLSTPRVRDLLRQADLAGIRGVMQSSAGIQEGMQTFDYAIFRLIKEGLVSEETGLSAADSPSDLKMRLRGLL